MTCEYDIKPEGGRKFINILFLFYLQQHNFFISPFGVLIGPGRGWGGLRFRVPVPFAVINTKNNAENPLQLQGKSEERQAIDGWTDRQGGRRTDRQGGRRTDSQTGRQT